MAWLTRHRGKVTVHPELTVIMGEPAACAESSPRWPLDETRNIYRLRRIIEPHLAAAACPMLKPVQLDWLEARIDLFTDIRTPAEKCHRLRRSFYANLLRPAMTNVVLSVVAALWRHIDDQVARGAVMLAAHPAELPPTEAGYRQLIAAFRTREPDRAAPAITDHLGQSETVVSVLVKAAGEPSNGNRDSILW